MDIRLAVSKIYPDAEYNPACFNFTEAEARAKKLWRDARAMPTQAELAAADTEGQKDVQVEALYETMVVEIYDKMEADIGTRNDVSVSANAATFEAMQVRPANYLGVNGLTTEAEVTAYAATQLDALDAFAVYRLNRLAQFQSDRAAVLNS